MTDQQKAILRGYIKKNEGVRRAACHDSLGIPTVGVGFKLEREDEWKRSFPPASRSRASGREQRG